MRPAQPFRGMVLRATLSAMARRTALGTLRGKTIELDDPVLELDGQRVRLVVEGAGDDEAALSVETQTGLWRDWVERGPQGPIDDEDAAP